MTRKSILTGVLVYLGFAGSALAASCDIYDINSLKACLSQGSAIDHYNFQSDVYCSGEECCGPGGSAAHSPLINLSGRDGVTIQGNGHVITRYSNHRACSVIGAYYARNISINDLQLDEYAGAERCIGTDACAAAIHIDGVDPAWSTSISMESVGVYNAKMIGIFIRAVNGFTFNNGVVSNAGVIGMHLNEKDAPWLNNVWVTNSVIAHTGANGLVLMGVFGSSTQFDNVIRNNVFDTNHVLGAYKTEHFQNPYTNGGQVYVAHVNSVVIDYNLIADGHCGTCDGWDGNGTVAAFELGGPVSGGGGPLTYLHIHANKLRNVYGAAFYTASDANIGPTTAIWNNDLKGVLKTASHGSTTVDRVPGATWGPNGRSDLSPTALSSGILSNHIYRMYDGWHHQEANWTWQHPNSWLGATYLLRGYPVPRASSKPIYRCLVSNGTGDDFPSHDMNCEGFTLHSILGYSWEPDYPGAVPLYRCLIGYNHFVSTDPNCEGQTFVEHVAYVIPQ